MFLRTINRFVIRQYWHNNKNINSFFAKATIHRNLVIDADSRINPGYSYSSPKQNKRFILRSFGDDRDDFESSIADAENDQYYDIEKKDETDPYTRVISKDILYNESDGLIKVINNCKNFDEVTKILNDKVYDFMPKHFVQSIIILWIRKPEELEKNKLNDFLCKFKWQIEFLSPDEITCCLLYLSKLGVDAGHETVKDLIQTLKARIADTSKDFPLSALSRCCVALNSCPKSIKLSLNKYAFLRAENYLPSCNTAESVRLITNCFHHLHQIVSKNNLTLYKAKVESLLDAKKLNSTSCTIKIINFLSFPFWSNQNSKLIRNLILTLRDSTDRLSNKEIVTLTRVFQGQLEPASIYPSLNTIAAKNVHSTKLELFECAVYFQRIPKNRELIAHLETLLNAQQEKKTESLDLLSLFKSLRMLKISDKTQCNKYWSLVLKNILEHPSNQESYRLARCCHRYMHFNNNLGGTYRFMALERTLVELSMKDIQQGEASLIPSRLAKLSSFVIAYGHTPDANLKIPDFIIEKLESMTKKFTTLDCLQISRGLRIAVELRFKNDLPSEIQSQLQRIEDVLSKCAEAHLADDLNIGEVNCLIRAFHNRPASRKTPLYKKLMDKFVTKPEDLNSRTVRDIAFNLSSSNQSIPQVCEHILDYIVKNKDHVIGETVEKVLYSCYTVGYVPENDDALYFAAEIIKRDFDSMNGLAIIQACLALAFYKALPETLINKVFSSEFIKRLEDDIQACYSKATYPERVLSHVMQLNRSVCLDFPEAKVPWFQQNYIEAQMSKVPVIRTKFHSEMEHMLKTYLQDEKLLRINHVTPYGYRIDFVIHLDQSRKPIEPPADSAVFLNVTKIAIILLKLESFCQNVDSQLKGPEQLRMRHLEMLGYKVVHINLNDWNSVLMHMPGAKLDHLKNLLEIS